MEIEVPSSLNSQELKCFEEIVRPQLEELYSCEYDKLEFKGVNIFISKEIKPKAEETKTVLNKVPERDLSFIKEIYFVSYNCKEDNDKIVRGRTLPIVYKLMIYPRAYEKLDVVLAHEIGHILFEKRLAKPLMIDFASRIIETFPQILLWPKERREVFTKEEFANCYDNFVNDLNNLKRFPQLYDFFMRVIC